MRSAGSGVELADERVGTLFDESGDVVVAYAGEREREDFVDLGFEGGEVAVEEDCVEDAWWFVSVEYRVLGVSPPVTACL